VSEHPGKGHWWDTILNTREYSEFVEKHTENPKNVVDELSSFTVTVVNPAGSGSKGGITVEQLVTPYHLGRIDVKIERDGRRNSTWHLSTTNIRRFRFEGDIVRKADFIIIYIDYVLVKVDSQVQDSNNVVFQRDEVNGWQVWHLNVITTFY
jgi:hypothetical protein